MELQPSYYFDFENFAHKSIFDGCTFVWEALSKIKTYLSSFSLDKIEIDIPIGVYLIHKELVSIGKNVVIEPGAYIKGPCIIGDGCQIRHGAYIRGDVIVGKNCVIGHDTEVKNSLFLDKAQAAHFAYLGDSILGNDVNLGAGVKCANLRLDHGAVSINHCGKKMDSGLKKFGAIIGDGAQLGCNSVTNPGTLIGKGAKSFPCTNFGGMVPPKTVVKPANPAIFV